jgi:hypothetical protein
MWPGFFYLLHRFVGDKSDKGELMVLKKKGMHEHSFFLFLFYKQFYQSFLLNGLDIDFGTNKLCCCLSLFNVI